MDNLQDPVKMEISPETLANLNATRKWTMFLSILGFIFLGLLVFAGLATGTFLTAFKAHESGMGVPEPLIIAGFAIIALVYFFSILFLYRFSINIRDAVKENDIKKLSRAFRNLRTFFTYIGIIFIIALSIYIVALIGVGSSISFLIGM